MPYPTSLIMAVASFLLVVWGLSLALWHLEKKAQTRVTRMKAEFSEIRPYFLRDPHNPGVRESLARLQQQAAEAGASDLVYDIHQLVSSTDRRFIDEWS